MGVITGCTLGLTLVGYALSDNLHFFYTPEALLTQGVTPGQMIRLGGRVATGSVHTMAHSAGVDFQLADPTSQVAVHYEGLLPDLFAEGQQVVAEGTWGTDGVLQAHRVLAKHDERYMPVEASAS